MKTRKYIGGFLAIIGLMAAVSVSDGSHHELLIRGIGLALFAAGALLGKWFDFQNQRP